jgi:meiotically up-regulated gene 157 (Mug157) protein
MTQATTTLTCAAMSNAMGIASERFTDSIRRAHSSKTSKISSGTGVPVLRNAWYAFQMNRPSFDLCLYAYFSPSWIAFQTDGGRDFNVIVDGVSV